MSSSASDVPRKVGFLPGDFKSHQIINIHLGYPNFQQRALVKNRELSCGEEDNTSFAAGYTSFPPSSDSGDKEGKRILIYSHSLPPWVDGVSFRFKAHCRMLKEEGHHVRYF
jgi:hypothetical protein